MFQETLLTAWCVCVVLGSLLVVGASVVWVLVGRRPLEEADWLLAPFAGLAVVVVVAQNLVYHDVPVTRSALLLWVAAVLVGFRMWRRGDLAASVRAFPRRVFAVALAAYLVQGLALFAVGARHHSGRAWEDQYTYTTVTQFLTDEPFRTHRTDIGQRPWLYRVLARAMGPLDFPSHKEHRIGQSILHGFFAATAFLPAKTLFMPTILLSCFLLVVAVYALGTGLGLARGPALLAGACAGVLPGLAGLSLEGFLSHALAVPLIVFWIEALRRLAITLRLADLALASLLITAMVAIYTDFGVPMLAETAVCLGLAVLGHPRPGRLLACLVALVCAPFVLNPHYAERTLAIWHWVSTPQVLAGIYPWAYETSGVARLWLGDWTASTSRVVRHAAQAAGVLLTVMGYAGLGWAAWKGTRQERPTFREWVATRAFALGALVFSLLPIVLLIKDREHPYQFYKMLLTVSPLLALGLAILCGSRPVGRALQALVLVLAALQTGRMSLETARAEARPRSAAHVLLHPDMKGLEKRLEALAGRDVVILQSQGPMVNGWLSYFARRNRLWLGDPLVFSDDIRKTPAALPILDLGRAPADALFLTDRDPRSPPAAGAQVLWENGSFRLWTPRPGPWAVVLRTENKNGLETVDGRPFFWIGQGATRLVVLAGQAGRLKLTADFVPGAFGPGQRLSVYVGPELHATLVIPEGRQELRVPVKPGVNEVRLVPQGRYVSTHPTDRRPMVLGVRDLAVELEGGGPS